MILKKSKQKIFNFLISINIINKLFLIRELTSSNKIALASIRLIKKLVGESRWQTAKDLLKILKEEGDNLFRLLPDEMVVKNIWKRVLKIIKDESVKYKKISLFIYLYGDKSRKIRRK